MAKTGTPWTEQEEDFVRENISILTIKEMADRLKRPYGGVAYKRAQIKEDMGFFGEIETSQKNKKPGLIKTLFRKLIG